MAMFPDADASVLGIGGLDLLPIDRMAMMRARRPIQNRSLMSRNPLYGEVMPPGMPDMYPVGAGEFLMNEVAPQTGAIGAPAQRMATARVKKIFGVPVPERRARTFLGGLAAMPAVTPGGGFGNFLAGLQGGLRGSLQAGDMYDQRQAEMEQAQADAERQAMRDDLYRQEVESRVAENEAQAARAAAPPGSPAPSGRQSLAAMTPEEFATLLSREGQLASAKRGPAKTPKATLGGTPKPPKVPAAKAKKLSDEMSRLDKVTEWVHFLQISQDRNVEPEVRQEAFRRYSNLRSQSTAAQGR